MNESAFHPEDKARSLIDRRLVACGWLIQSRDQINLGAGLGVAVREFQTASGPVDYGLFVGRKLCGVIEAKAEGTTLSGHSEQAARGPHRQGAGAVRRAPAGAAGRVDGYPGSVISINGIYQKRRRIMSATAKLFMHGRSQAVRLPKEFRFEGTEVRVSKVGDKVILEPLKKQPFDAEAWFARLDELGARDFLPDGIPDDPPVEPDPRKFFDE